MGNGKMLKYRLLGEQKEEAHIPDQWRLPEWKLIKGRVEVFHEGNSMLEGSEGALEWKEG